MNLLHLEILRHARKFDREREPDSTSAYVKHLICYVCPRAGTPVWRWNAGQLLSRIGLFDGRRTCAIAVSPDKVKPRIGGKQPFDLDPPDAVREALAGHDFQFVEVPNHPSGGESAAFPYLWASLPRLRSRVDVTFYCHAKGVTYDPLPEHIRRWAEILYSANLDFPEMVLEQFRMGYNTVGTMLRPSPGTNRLHYSGTFFWFRNLAAFSRHWNIVSQWRWGGIESWPGRVFRPAEMGQVFEPEPAALTAYSPEFVAELHARFLEWKANHESQRDTV